MSSLQILHVLIESVCKHDLTTSGALSALHLHNHLPSGHLLLLRFKFLSTTLHAVNFLLVSGLLCFSFLPLAIRNVGHDFHALLHFLLLFIDSLFLEVLDLLLVAFLLLLDQALLEPFFEGTLTLFLLVFLFKAFMLLFPQLLLLLESLGD